MDPDEARIARVFGAKNVPKVSQKNLLKYRQYLLKHFDRKTILTGREDFPWEEYYVLGPGSLAEYEKLKKTSPSYTDKYEFIDISEEEVEENDLLATVKRLSDGKNFEVGLSWFTTEKEVGEDFQLLDDFATWVVNWQQ